MTIPSTAYLFLKLLPFFAEFASATYVVVRIIQPMRDRHWALKYMIMIVVMLMGGLSLAGAEVIYEHHIRGLPVGLSDLVIIGSACVWALLSTWVLLFHSWGRS